MEAHFPDPAAPVDEAPQNQPDVPARQAPGEPPPHDRGLTTPAGQEVPHVTPEQLNELLQAQRDQRQELANLRKELAESRKSAWPSGPPAAVLDADTLRKQRAEELSAHEFYCNGCGRLYDYPQRCTGRPEAPHPPIEVIPTDEVQGAPDPRSVDEYRQWEQGHTAAPDTDLDSLRRAGVL